MDPPDFSFGMQMKIRSLSTWERHGDGGDGGNCDEREDKGIDYYN